MYTHLIDHATQKFRNSVVLLVWLFHILIVCVLYMVLYHT